MIGILNLEIGNLRSVWNAIYQNGFDPVIIENEKKIGDCERLILPGVGSFPAGVEKLAQFQEGILRHVHAGKPLLGICVGMQMLADEGEEGGVVSKGLGLISGKVSRLPGGPKQPVPHVGWNNVEFRRPHPVTEGLKSDVDFYFVHSYALQCADKRDMLGATNYGLEFCSIAARDQVVGFQFHPEKSQVNGLKLLENFCRWKP